MRIEYYKKLHVKLGKISISFKFDYRLNSKDLKYDFAKAELLDLKTKEITLEIDLETGKVCNLKKELEYLKILSTYQEPCFTISIYSDKGVLFGNRILKKCFFPDFLQHALLVCDKKLNKIKFEIENGYLKDFKINKVNLNSFLEKNYEIHHVKNIT